MQKSFPGTFACREAKHSFASLAERQALVRLTFRWHIHVPKPG